MNDRDMRTIKSARRVLEILEYFDQRRRHATVMELSRAFNYPQSSTSELLRCLTRLGYLHYNRYRRTYSPTARVALLGSWVEPNLFRGGTVLTALDRIADTIGETVVLSTASNYIVQHLHVLQGEGEDAVPEQAGATETLLHSAIGRLLLSSFDEKMIRSALHRLNAEEADPGRRVNVVETIEELRALRAKGWIVDENARGEGVGIVSVLLPLRRGTERLALSVLASSAVVREQAEQIIGIVGEEGAELFGDRKIVMVEPPVETPAPPAPPTVSPASRPAPTRHPRPLYA